MFRQIAISFVLIGLTHMVLTASKISERPSLRACRNAFPSSFIRVRRGVVFRPQVFNGFRTRPAEFPYMVALGWQSSSPGLYEYRCGGVLISPQHVLTAAHCASPTKPAVVLPGGVELVSYVSNEPYHIDNVVIHPKYKHGSIYDDIAVVILKNSVSFSNTRKPICLWRDNNIADNTPITAIGYGLTETGKQSMELLKGNLATVSNGKCNAIFKNFNSVKKGILKSQICAKDPNELQATCKGDSGGPLVFERFEEGATRSYVLGITSQGVGCGTKFPGIYTRVSSYLSWIEKIVWK